MTEGGHLRTACTVVGYLSTERTGDGHPNTAVGGHLSTALTGGRHPHTVGTGGGHPCTARTGVVHLCTVVVEGRHLSKERTVAGHPVCAVCTGVVRLRNTRSRTSYVVSEPRTSQPVRTEVELSPARQINES